MKITLLLCLLWGLGCWRPVLAAPATPADTLPGHARLVRMISASLCEQLSTHPAAEIDHLSEPAVQELVRQLMTKAMLRDSVALLTMMQQAQERGQNPRQVGNALGYDAMVRLDRECPAALPLIARVGTTKQAQRLAAANQPAIAEADRAALQPIATGICTQVSAANARKPFASLTPAQREAQVTLFFRQQFAANRPRLLRRYTAAQLADEQFLNDLGAKVARLMLAQESCNQFMLQVGADDVNRQRASLPKP